MKKAYYFILVAIGLLGMSSCTQDDYELQKENTHPNVASRAMSSSDSLVNESIIPLVIDSSLFERAKTRIAPSYEDNNYDEYFSSNMWNLRGLPVTLKAKSNGRYLSSNGAGKEISLSVRNQSANEYFHLEILPASSGIPYLIYSQVSNTPLAVGQYDSNPNNKVLYAQPNGSSSLYSAGWDLIPSTYYKGYFAIQSESYLGQSDPNNMWSVFNYVLEVKNNNTIGYGQYTKKTQQEFLLEFMSKFNVKDISFDSESAIVTQLEPIVIKSSGQTAPVAGPSNITIYAKKDVKDTSYYAEKGALKVSMSNPNQLFFRPTVIAGQFIAPENFSSGETPDTTLFMPKAPYTSTMYEIPKQLSVTIPVAVNEPSLVQITTYLKKYSVKADYIITMTYRRRGETTDREVKFKGTWNGVVHTTSKAKPDDIVITSLEEYMRKLSSKQITNKQ